MFNDSYIVIGENIINIFGYLILLLAVKYILYFDYEDDYVDNNIISKKHISPI